MTIRAKLYAAMVMTVLGPLVTIGVAFAAFQSLSDRFDEVSARSDRQALALEIKYAVTDVNGWQTAYGYDDGASRPQFERSAQNVRRLLAVAHRTLTEPRERAILARLQSSFDAFMALDVVAYRALRAGQDRRVKQIFLGPEIRNFEAMAAAAGQLAAEEQRRNDQVERSFDQRLTDAKKTLVVVGLGAGVLIVLLLLTASDIARLALEQQASREPMNNGMRMAGSVGESTAPMSRPCSNGRPKTSAAAVPVMTAVTMTPTTASMPRLGQTLRRISSERFSPP